MNYTSQLLENSIQSSFVDNIWGANLDDIKLISKFNNLILCLIEIYCKYAWAISLKNKKRYYNYQYFSENFKKSNRKPKKIWIDKGSKCYNKSMKSELEKNDIEMYSAHNDGKSVISKRLIKTLKNISTWIQYHKMCILIN